MLNKKAIWIVVTAIVALGAAGGIAGLTAMGQRTAEGHITVTEARLRAAELQGLSIRIAGTVVPGSLSWDTEARTTEFVLADTNNSIEVTYKSVMPNNFKPGNRVAVDGKLAPDGKFQASDIPTNALCNVCHT